MDPGYSLFHACGGDPETQRHLSQAIQRHGAISPKNAHKMLVFQGHSISSELLELMRVDSSSPLEIAQIGNISTASSKFDERVPTASESSQAVCAPTPRGIHGDFMDASSSDENVVETRGLEPPAMENLKSKKTLVPNARGTCRCRCCSSKEEQFYHSLCNHAGCSETRCQCHPVSRFLRLKPGEDPFPVTESAEARERTEHRMVHPWVGLVYNAQNVGPDGRRISPEPGDLRYMFDEFHPKQVLEFWSTDDGHPRTGIAVLTFARDMEGYRNCRLLERAFLEVRRGRQQWLQNKGTDRQGTDLYGWMAGEDDYNGIGLVGEFLRSKHHLKTLSQALEEEKIRTKEQLQKKVRKILRLQWCVDEKDAEKTNLIHNEEAAELEQAMMKMEGELQRLRAKHRQVAELGSVRAHSQRVKKFLNEQMTLQIRELEGKLSSLFTGYKEMSIKESQDQAEMKRLKRELDQANLLLEVGSKSAQEREKEKNREDEIQQQKLDLAQSVAKNAELEEKIKDLEEEKERAFDLVNSQSASHRKAVTELEDEIEQHKLRLAQSTTKNEELERKLKELEELKQGALNVVNSLFLSRRKALIQLQDAKKAAVAVIQAIHNDVHEGIGVERFCEIDDSGWNEAGDANYNHWDWKVQLTKIRAERGEMEMERGFFPFKRTFLHPDGTQWIAEVYPEDPLFKPMTAKSGEKPYHGVITALKEFQEYHPTGWDTDPTLCNFAAEGSHPLTRGRAASLGEVVSYLGNIIDTEKRTNRDLQAEITKLKRDISGTGEARRKRKKTEA